MIFAKVLRRVLTSATFRSVLLSGFLACVVGVVVWTIATRHQSSPDPLKCTDERISQRSDENLPLRVAMMVLIVVGVMRFPSCEPPARWRKWVWIAIPTLVSLLAVGQLILAFLPVRPCP